MDEKYRTPPNPLSNRQARLRRHACERKTPLTQAVVERIAGQVRNDLSRARNKRMVAYQCPYCGKWHVGHQKTYYG